MACTDPDAIEYARRTGHARILEQLDPDHPDHDPRYGPIVRRLNREAAADDPDGSKSRRAAKPRVALGSRPPAPAPGRR